ncbi:hypothetical protein AHiyo8_12710 [Arthrobacter sp. Hiyo8]|nr:hypothetical protein AHiyo8_12710 [Arthrobacter sp. Hiyo8]
MTTMVLPAPVSPVTTLRPGPNGKVASVMTPRSRIRSSSIMVYISFVGSAALPVRTSWGVGKGWA